MASLVAYSLAVPPPRDGLNGTSALRELTNGPPCLGLALGLAAVAWASVSAVAVLLV
jgi:hypothetical protein